MPERNIELVRPRTDAVLPFMPRICIENCREVAILTRIVVDRGWSSRSGASM